MIDSTEARVMRIMCATTTSTRSMVGRKVRNSRSLNGMSGVTLASEGNQPSSTEMYLIRRYPRKYSGTEIVIKVTTLTERS